LTNIWLITRKRANIYSIKNLVSEKVINFDLRSQVDSCTPLSNWYYSNNYNQEWELSFHPKKNAYSLRCKYNNAKMHINWADSTTYACIKPNTNDTLFRIDRINFTDGYLSLLSKPQKITDYIDLLPEGEKISKNEEFTIERKRHIIRTDTAFFVNQKKNYFSPKILYKIQNPINGELKSYIDNKVEIHFSQSQYMHRRFFNSQYFSNSELLKCFTNNYLNTANSLNVNKYFDFINPKENHVYISLIELDSIRQYTLKKNINCDLNSYYTKKVNIGNHISFICHGNFTFNQIKHFCLYYFDKGLTTGNILNIDIDRLKRTLQFDIVKEDGSVIYNQSIHKVEELISNSQSSVISIELANTCDNSPLYKYSVVEGVLKECISGQ
jgi:hypothetical protein